MFTLLNLSPFLPTTLVDIVNDRPVTVCMDRIGELKEVMDDIIRKQCDYDPTSGDSYDFDR